MSCIKSVRSTDKHIVPFHNVRTYRITNSQAGTASLPAICKVIPIFLESWQQGQVLFKYNKIKYNKRKQKLSHQAWLRPKKQKRKGQREGPRFRGPLVDTPRNPLKTLNWKSEYKRRGPGAEVLKHRFFYFSLNN